MASFGLCVIVLRITSGASAGCSINFDAGTAVEPSVVAGLNDVLGPIVNLSYSDAALFAATSALGVAALRHPGGTVANVMPRMHTSL